MNTDKRFSKEHEQYLKRIKREKRTVIVFRAAILVLILGIWELLADIGIIDSFVSSSPSRIAKTIGTLFTENNLVKHSLITLYETMLGFVIAVGVGYVIALLLWWSERARIIVAIITMLNGFLATDENKILLLRSMGATKFQILLKLVIPGSLPTFISMLKISVGMAWIGSIMGEYLVSRAGLGYLIVYGGQVFKLDLVMAATFVLCVLATLMYALVALLEKIIIRYDK